jgi:glutamine synthetase adenylyltransferase
MLTLLRASAGAKPISRRCSSIRNNRARRALQALARGPRQYLARYLILLDELLDARTLHAPPAWPQLRAVAQNRRLGWRRQRSANERAAPFQARADLPARQDLAGELPLEKLTTWPKPADATPEVLRVARWASHRHRRAGVRDHCLR